MWPRFAYRTQCRDGNLVLPSMGSVHCIASEGELIHDRLVVTIPDLAFGTPIWLPIKGRGKMPVLASSIVAFSTSLEDKVTIVRCSGRSRSLICAQQMPNGS